MGFGVFIHRSSSRYDDVPSKQYQFPRRYMRAAQECEGNWILYLEPVRAKNPRGYFAVARIREIVPDQSDPDMHLALIEEGSYLDFGIPVPFRMDGEVLEQGLLNEKGQFSGRRQNAVRAISPEDFERILDHGLGKEEDIRESLSLDPSRDFDDWFAGDRLRQLTSRAIRDHHFRTSVMRAYDDTCAITGLQMFNGKLAEAQAAHIRPVKAGGPDITSNGIALSGTVHWMFDRGLIGLDDDKKILVSRQANNPEAGRAMINPTGHLLRPKREADLPRLEFIRWHREHCFKQ